VGLGVRTAADPGNTVSEKFAQPSARAWLTGGSGSMGMRSSDYEALAENWRHQLGPQLVVHVNFLAAAILSTAAPDGNKGRKEPMSVKWSYV
jgi:hypothetical protein